MKFWGWPETSIYISRWDKKKKEKNHAIRLTIGVKKSPPIEDGRGGREKIRGWEEAQQEFKWHGGEKKNKKKKKKKKDRTNKLAIFAAFRFR